MQTLQMPSGRAIPILGQGTWLMGEDRAQRPREMAALRLGLDLGMSLIDTAEMYGDGASEELVGEVMAGRPRTDIFLVSKVLPHHATKRGVLQACENSLRRLKTEYLDLYLLHWRGSVPLSETLDAFELLKEKGAIRDYGVSNFDTQDMEEARTLRGGKDIATNQVLYNLAKRGIEWDLLPWSRAHGIPIMAYSPIEHSSSERRGMLDKPALQKMASRHNATPVQVALAWLLQRQVVVIPKAASPEHVRENRAALDVHLTEQDLKELDQMFPPPHKKSPLEMR